MVINKESVYNEEIGRTVPIGRVDAPLPRGSML